MPQDPVGRLAWRAAVRTVVLGCGLLHTSRCQPQQATDKQGASRDHPSSPPVTGIAAGPRIGIVVPPRYGDGAGHCSAVGRRPPLFCSAVLAKPVVVGPEALRAGVVAASIACMTAERNWAVVAWSKTATSEPRTTTRKARSRPTTSRHAMDQDPVSVMRHRLARCRYSIPVDTSAARTSTAQRAESVGIAARRASRIAGRASSTPIVSESLFGLLSYSVHPGR
ncbi:hypothetical protein ATK36_5384 [Amycolatopsis sulphurea]|uniref:Uncharacterized protein n=1 Tax=Amycolatopsis sulphurea TaxID=76022 RepID=A0A2A9FHD2_9PSEU|nr:hypothetical protein ATK36_5384 [Amycolatopsis sulphurea]